MGRWSALVSLASEGRTLGPQMFLDYNSQKSWPEQLVVKASGSFSLRTSREPRLGTTAVGLAAVDSNFNKADFD